MAERQKAKILGSNQGSEEKFARFGEMRQLELDTLQVWNLVNMQIRIELVYTSESADVERYRRFTSYLQNLEELKLRLDSLPFTHRPRRVKLQKPKMVDSIPSSVRNMKVVETV